MSRASWVLVAQLVLSVVTGVLLPTLLDALKARSRRLKRSRGAVKQLVAFGLAAIPPLLSVLSEVTPAQLETWAGAGAATVIGGLLGIAIKQQQQLTRRPRPTAREAESATDPVPP